jgi:RasGEF N-terminal motif
MQDFLLVYRAFTTGQHLLDLLKARYTLKPPTHKAATAEEMDKIIAEFCNRQKVIRLRVFNVLKKVCAMYCAVFSWRQCCAVLMGPACVWLDMPQWNGAFGAQGPCDGVVARRSLT